MMQPLTSLIDNLILLVGTFAAALIVFMIVVAVFKAKKGKKKAKTIVSKQQLEEPVSKPKELTLALIRDIEWKNFENLCCEYFIVRGFDARVTSIGADGGIDINLYKRGTDTLAMIVQCKAYSNNVGVKDVREFYGVLAASKAQGGVFITTSDFTSDAQSFAKDVMPQLQLASGERFISLIQKLSVDAQQRLLNVAIEGDYKTPTCAKCDIKMVVRQGKNGPFFGCLNYPSCRSTLNISRV